MNFDDALEGHTQEFGTDFKIGDTIHFPNTRKQPVKVTVGMGPAGAVSFICIIGGTFSIKCGNTPMTLQFDDVDDVT